MLLVATILVLAIVAILSLLFKILDYLFVPTLILIAIAIVIGILM